MKPVFNVPPVFQGVVSCTMNLPMAELVSRLIHEQEGTVEEELVAFGRRLFAVRRDAARNGERGDERGDEED